MLVQNAEHDEVVTGHRDTFEQFVTRLVAMSPKIDAPRAVPCLMGRTV